MNLEANAIARFRHLAVIPDECRVERRLVQGKLCLIVDCPNPELADRLWRNQHQLVAPLGELALGERAIVHCKGRVWHPAFRDAQ
jgi:hypothetical protein